jgi:hypothetical protein
MQKSIIYTGQNIQQSHTEVLAGTTIEGVWNRISMVNSELAKETALLRRVARLDAAASQRLKTRLPYICCSSFKGGLRKLDNLEAAHGFILDFDHLSRDPEIYLELVSRLKQDIEVALFYKSPSGCGLKIIFLLDHPIIDATSYSRFYKYFATTFANRYGLEDALDTSTSDVTRVSFLCHDPEAWCNPSPAPVHPGQFFSSKQSIQQEIEENGEAGREIEKMESNRLTGIQYRSILDTLHPERPAKPLKQIFVPRQLDEIMVHIQAQAAATGIEIAEVQNINYGKKVIFVKLPDRAEVNVFYGKRGFSVVKSPKRGSNELLAEIGERIILLALASPLTKTQEVTDEHR